MTGKAPKIGVFLKNVYLLKKKKRKVKKLPKNTESEIKDVY